MKDFYFAVLERAEKRGLFNTFDVSDEIRKYIKKSPIYKTKPTNWQDVPKMLLDPLVERKYVGIMNFEFPKINDAPDNWLDELVAIIYILPDGLLFLFEKKKIRQQTWTNRLTFLFIVITLLVAIGNYYYSNKSINIIQDNNSQSNTIKQLSKHIKQLQQDSLKTIPKHYNNQ